MQNEKGPLKYYGGSIMINLKDLTFEELQQYDKEFNKKFTQKQLQNLIIGLSKKL